MDKNEKGIHPIVTFSKVLKNKELQMQSKVVGG